MLTSIASALNLGNGTGTQFLFSAMKGAACVGERAKKQQYSDSVNQVSSECKIEIVDIQCLLGACESVKIREISQNRLGLVPRVTPVKITPVATM